MRLFGFGRLTFEETDDYGKIVDYCEARVKRNKPCLKPVALQQIRNLLRDDPVHPMVQPSLKIKRQIDGGWSGWIDEQVDVTTLKTGHFEDIIDEIMERAGRAERDGAVISLGHEKSVGVTVNCRTPNTLICMLITKLPSQRFGLYINPQQERVAGATFATGERTGEKTVAGARETIEVRDIKEHLVHFAQTDKTIEFLQESLKVKGSEIGELAAEVLVSEPAFAETLAQALASTYSFVKQSGARGATAYADDPMRKLVGEAMFAETLGEVRAKMSGPVMDMGRAAHLLMRALRRDPTLGRRTEIVNSLRRVISSGDPFVSGNAEEALRILREANQPAFPSGPQERGSTKPSGVVQGRRSASGKGYLCPYCGKGDYEPYPSSNSQNRRCRHCATVFSTVDIAS